MSFMTRREITDSEFGRWMEENSDAITDTPTLRALALPYADHPDYREEWRH